MLFGLGAALAGERADPPNLLRNPRFQDDWATQIPQTKTLHWTYSSEYQNRRDYVPDGWALKGSWEWVNEDAAPGDRRLLLRGPGAEARQRTHWIAVHDDAKLDGFPDSGRFPTFLHTTSSRPLRMVRDLRLRVHARGRDVPAGAATVELALAPPGDVSSTDAMGSEVPATAATKLALPSGRFEWGWFETTLAAADWLAAAETARKSATTTEIELPSTISVSLRYAGATGELEIDDTELTEPGPDSPDLMRNGGFEEVTAGGAPVGFDPPVRYGDFPPGRYYAFTTWHNEGFPNRGVPALDALVVHGGRRSLRMPLPAGDEVMIASAPIRLAQTNPRFVEVTAWVKTDRANQIQIDAVDETGARLDGFHFIHKALVSIGTDDWHLVRQVFRPRVPVTSISIRLCGRGVNGYTLDGTGGQPQANVAGTIWWDDVRVYEPESTAEELRTRGVVPPPPAPTPDSVRLEHLDLGERLLGTNFLRAEIVNPGPPESFRLEWQLDPPRGRATKFTSDVKSVATGASSVFEIPYEVGATPLGAYTEYRGTLRVLGQDGQVVAETIVPVTPWAVPLDLHLGALYLRPEQSELVRANLGISSKSMASVSALRLEVIRRASGAVVSSREVPVSLQGVRVARTQIPSKLRGDLTNLVLADLDVSALPIERFNEPERRFFVRATVLDRSRHVLARADSDPFCRLAHEPRQPPIQQVKIENGFTFVNGEPWMPWGATYAFAPSYGGPADPGAGDYLDLRNLKGWSPYDGYDSAAYDRRTNDLNTLRYVPVADPKLEEHLAQRWQDDDLYASTVFLGHSPGPFAIDELAAQAGGRDALDARMRFVANAPMIVSSAPGFEEEFGTFHGVNADRLRQLEAETEVIRHATGKPVMVGHGGAWNRFEFAKVPFFDIFDPETEPLFPANLRDLAPVTRGGDKVVWLRPQIYESVPYERWRFHTYVELMRGARGWQMAHGPSDATTFRGLHGEMEFWKPIAARGEPVRGIVVEPAVEHWSRRFDGKTYVIAATTHAQTLGAWRWSDDPPGEAGRARVTTATEGDEDDGILSQLLQRSAPTLITHAIDELPEPPTFPAGSRLVQWVKPDASSVPRNLLLLARTDGRWIRGASFGELDPSVYRRNPILGAWLLRRLYRNAVGFVGYDGRGLLASLEYLPSSVAKLAEMPRAGEWTKLEVPLSSLGAEDVPLEGVAFAHDGGRVSWGRTSIVTPDGRETTLWGDSLALAPASAQRVRIEVPGLRKGTRVRVVFEDRDIVADDGSFSDDFRGSDLYQRFGGLRGYGSDPVALHAYEIP